MEDQPAGYLVLRATQSHTVHGGDTSCDSIYGIELYRDRAAAVGHALRSGPTSFAEAQRYRTPDHDHAAWYEVRPVSQATYDRIEATRSPETRQIPFHHLNGYPLGQTLRGVGNIASREPTEQRQVQSHTQQQTR